MPKIFNAGKAVDDWYKEAQEGSSGFDVCRVCWPKIQKNPSKFFDKLKPYNGDPQGDHYEGGGFSCYTEDVVKCEVCNAVLTAQDEDDGEDET